jgi:hypothetical protein
MIGLYSPLLGQSIPGKHSPNPSLAVLWQSYQDSLQTSALIYRGSRYKYYDIGIEGHPYFKEEGNTKGNVYYNGILYRDIDLYYDLNRQEVITEHNQMAYAA